MVDQEGSWFVVSYWLRIVPLYVLFLVIVGSGYLSCLDVVSCDMLVWPRRTDG